MSLYDRSLLDLEYWPGHSNTSDQKPKPLPEYPSEGYEDFYWQRYQEDSVAVGQARPSTSKSEDKP